MGNRNKVAYLKNLQSKIVTWNEATASRPPLRIDMSGPTATRYHVTDKKSFTSSPAYSFGRKCNNIVTSADGRNVSPFLIQTSSNTSRPSPANYDPPQALGNGEYCYSSAPAFSIGPKTPFQEYVVKGSKRGQLRGNIYKRSSTRVSFGHSDGPSATSYSPGKSERLTMQRAPAFSMGGRNATSGFLGNAQRAARENPACNKYNPLHGINASKNRSSTFSVVGARRCKRHDTGPFATLWKIKLFFTFSYMS